MKQEESYFQSLFMNGSPRVSWEDQLTSIGILVSVLCTQSDDRNLQRALLT